MRQELPEPDFESVLTSLIEGIEEDRSTFAGVGNMELQLYCLGIIRRMGTLLLQSQIEQFHIQNEEA